MLNRVQLEDFRCFADASFETEGRSVALVGPNAVGKTSVLEALYVLGYGRSFRTIDRAQLIRRGAGSFQVGAVIQDDSGEAALTLRWSREGARVRVGERDADGLAEVSNRLKAHLIEPGIHRLIEGGPAERRRLLDVGVFHVEHAYVAAWRLFRRVLKQRNAALRGPQPERSATAWNEEFCRVARQLDDHRRRYLDRWNASFRSTAAALGLLEAGLEYRPGWPADESLDLALSRTLQRDVAASHTSVGPHRADVAITLASRLARRVVSRGQQKLLASALILGQGRLAAQDGGRPLLLLDDPGAELDVDNLGKFLRLLQSLPFQIVSAATFPAALEGLGDVSWFHVEQGRISPML